MNVLHMSDYREPKSIKSPEMSIEDKLKILKTQNKDLSEVSLRNILEKFWWENKAEIDKKIDFFQKVADLNIGFSIKEIVVLIDEREASNESINQIKKVAVLKSEFPSLRINILNEVIKSFPEERKDDIINIVNSVIDIQEKNQDLSKVEILWLIQRNYWKSRAELQYLIDDDKIIRVHDVNKNNPQINVKEVEKLILSNPKLSKEEIQQKINNKRSVEEINKAIAKECIKSVNNALNVKKWKNEIVSEELENSVKEILERLKNWLRKNASGAEKEAYKAITEYFRVIYKDAKKNMPLMQWEMVWSVEALPLIECDKVRKLINRFNTSFSYVKLTTEEKKSVEKSFMKDWSEIKKWNITSEKTKNLESIYKKSLENPEKVYRTKKEHKWTYYWVIIFNWNFKIDANIKESPRTKDQNARVVLSLAKKAIQEYKNKNIKEENKGKTLWSINHKRKVTRIENKENITDQEFRDLMEAFAA